MRAPLRVVVPIVCFGLPVGRMSAQQSNSGTPRTPATNYTIVMETKQSESGEGHVIYVDNRSSQDIIVTSVSLTECDNVRESCHPMPLKMRINAGDKRVVLRIHPRSDDRGYSYRSSFAWELVNDAPRQIARAEPVPPAPPPGAILVPRSGASALIDAQDFHPAVPAVDTGSACIPTADLQLPNGRSALLMRFGPERAPLRQVMIELDSAGRPAHYSDARGDLVAPEGAASPDAAPTGFRTVIAIDLLQQVGMVQNQGGGRPSEKFAVRGAGILVAPTLGTPATMILRVIQECGKRSS